MSIERSKSSSIDGQWIRDNESKDFEYGYSKSDDAKTAYQIIVKRLALNKIKNEILFNGMLDAQLRAFDRDGIIISRQQLIDDINKEVARQCLSFDLDGEVSLETPVVDMQPSQVQSEIDKNKNDLTSIFDATPTQSQQSINARTSISRDPTIESKGIATDPENSILQPANIEQEKEKIKNQMQQAQEQLAQTLEWAKQQPNVPQFTSTRSDNIESAPEWTKDKGISDYSKISIEQVNKGFDSQIQQEQNIDDIYDLEIKKLTQFKKDNNPNYEVALNNAIRKISSLTDRISDVRGQIESDIEYELSNSLTDQLSNQDQQSKDALINEIIRRMADAGEFSYIPLEDVSQRVDAMNMVKRRLQEKSNDELEIIFNSYVNQYEKTESNSMHR